MILYPFFSVSFPILFLLTVSYSQTQQLLHLFFHCWSSFGESPSQPWKSFLCLDTTLWHGLLALWDQWSIIGCPTWSWSSQLLNTQTPMAKLDHNSYSKRRKSTEITKIKQGLNAEPLWQNSGEHITSPWVPGGQGMKDVLQCRGQSVMKRVMIQNSSFEHWSPV